MQTKIIKITVENTKEAVKESAKVIKDGGLVVFPTETVYGLGASVFDEKALAKIFSAKGRPSDNPVIVHISDQNELKKLTDSVGEIEQKLIDKFWPGPLTIIFKKKKEISQIVSGGLSTIAIRMPLHPIAQMLIKESGVPISAPSANTSGRPSGTTGQDVFTDLNGKVDIIIDAGQSEIGVESTVIKVEKNKIYILRPGAVTGKMLQKVISSAKVIFSTNKKRLRLSPGTRYKHYAPKAKIEIFNNARAFQKRLIILRKKNKKVGILKKRKLKEVAKNLYKDLRDLDRGGVDVILIKSLPKRGLGIAIMDRLNRATSN